MEAAAPFMLPLLAHSRYRAEVPLPYFASRCGERQEEKTASLSAPRRGHVFDEAISPKRCIVLGDHLLRAHL
jgi:hypothetical protein